jgi:hypothetical protein
MTVHVEDIAARAGTHDQDPAVWPAADLRNGYALLFERDPNRPFVTTPVRGEEWQRQGHRFTGLLWARVADLEPLAGGPTSVETARLPHRALLRVPNGRLHHDHRAQRHPPGDPTAATTPPHPLKPVRWRGLPPCPRRRTYPEQAGFRNGQTLRQVCAH